jgi:hypothetical protein
MRQSLRLAPDWRSEGVTSHRKKARKVGVPRRSVSAAWRRVVLASARHSVRTKVIYAAAAPQLLENGFSLSVYCHVMSGEELIAYLPQ